MYYKLIYLILVIILFLLLYSILSIVFNVESKDNKRAFENSRIRKKIFKNPKHIFSKFIKLSKYKKDDIEASLFSLNMDITAEQYISENIFDASLLLGPTLFLLVLENYFISLILFFISIIIFIDRQGRLKRMLYYRRTQIEEEAPTLIRYFMVSLKNTSDIKKIFEDYSEIAGYLKRDIELTVIDMSSIRNNEDNIIRSLEIFDDRLNTPIMNDFITGLINVTMGKNQESYFALLERELRELSMQALKRKSNKIEKNIIIYFWILIGAFSIIASTEFIVFIIASFTF